MSDNTNTFMIRGTFERLETFTTKAGKDIITVILSTNGSYPQKIPVKCLFKGTVAAAQSLGKGDMVEATGRLVGREWNGKVFGENVAETIEVMGGKQERKEPPQAEEDPNLPF